MQAAIGVTSCKWCMLHETSPIDRHTCNFTYSICTMELHVSVPFMYMFKYFTH